MIVFPKVEIIILKNVKSLIIDKLKENKDFCDAFSKTVDTYSQRHNTIKKNGELYILEETSWILSLSLQHLDKKILFNTCGQ